jgi:hypothetical protein
LEVSEIKPLNHRLCGLSPKRKKILDGCRNPKGGFTVPEVWDSFLRFGVFK